MVQFEYLPSVNEYCGLFTLQRGNSSANQCLKTYPLSR